MEKSSSNYEIVHNQEGFPYVIYVHTKTRMQEDGFLDHDGKLIVPQLMEHWHKALEINYVFNGQWIFMVNGEVTHLGSGDVLLINCEAIHSVQVDFDTVNDNLLAICLQIDDDFLRTLIPDIDSSIFINDILEVNPRVRDKMDEIYQTIQKREKEFLDIKVKGLICELLYEICRTGAKKEKSIISINKQKNVERLRGIIQYVEDNYMSEITLEKTATRFYFSRGYFTRFFKDYTGMTFKEYVTKYRLGKAMELLKKSDMNMTEIAMQSGFSDTRRFILAFKKYYQQTPYQYKLNVLQNGNFQDAF